MTLSVPFLYCQQSRASILSPIFKRLQIIQNNTRNSKEYKEIIRIQSISRIQFQNLQGNLKEFIKVIDKKLNPLMLYDLHLPASQRKRRVDSGRSSSATSRVNPAQWAHNLKTFLNVLRTLLGHFGTETSACPKNVICQAKQRSKNVQCLKDVFRLYF